MLVMLVYLRRQKYFSVSIFEKNSYIILVLLLVKEQDVALSIFNLLLKRYKFYKENYNTS